jgi:hypothetical protein
MIMIMKEEEEDFLVAITGISLAIIPPLISAVAEALRPRITLDAKIILPTTPPTTTADTGKVTIRVTATSEEAPIDHIYYVLKDANGKVIMEGRIPNTNPIATTSSSNTFTADINITNMISAIIQDDSIIIVTA